MFGEKRAALFLDNLDHVVEDAKYLLYMLVKDCLEMDRDGGKLPPRDYDVEFDVIVPLTQKEIKDMDMRHERNVIMENIYNLRRLTFPKLSNEEQKVFDGIVKDMMELFPLKR